MSLQHIVVIKWGQATSSRREAAKKIGSDADDFRGSGTPPTSCLFVDLTARAKLRKGAYGGPYAQLANHNFSPMES